MNDNRADFCYVNEIFYSIQGEGVFMGCPTVFIRLATCNLHCSWCDTKYAWSEGLEMSCDEVVRQAMKFSSSVMYCITGGEPLLQKPQVEYIVKQLPAPILIETNCTIKPFESTKVFWSVSPKMPSANVGPVNTDVLTAYADQHPRVQFKFVIEDKVDLDVAARLIDEYLPTQVCIFQPQGELAQSLDDYLALMRNLVRKVKERKLFVHVLPQLHKILWFDEQRGR